jgi:hypothetical protein
MSPLPSKALKEGVFSDCRMLLTSDVSFNGWEYSVGTRRAFYIRGVTRFRNQFLPQHTDIAKSRSVFEEILKEHDAWASHEMTKGFKWSEPLADRQAFEALSIRNRRPIQFPKAVKVIVYCQAAARRAISELGAMGSEYDVYDMLAIQPAVFYISRFDAQKLASFLDEDPLIIDRLIDQTGQQSRDLFSEMATGYTVTQKTALDTRALLIEKFGEGCVGEVGFQPRGNDEGKASENETVW